MKTIKRLPRNFDLMVLSLSLAIVLWLFVSYDKESETEIMMPVQYLNLGPGLVIANQPPTRLDVRIAGPRIQFMRMHPDRLVVSLDLKNIKEGTVAFTELDKAVPVRKYLRVTRVYPGAIEVKLVRKR